MVWKISRRQNPEDKKFSVLDFILAIRANGLPQARNTFWGTNAGRDVRPGPTPVEVDSACAIGQAALNMGVDWGDLATTMSRIDRKMYHDIITWNDTYNFTISDIADRLKEKYPQLFDIEFNLSVAFDIDKG